MSDIGSKTLFMGDKGTESFHAPQYGLLVDFSQMGIGTSKKYNCSLSFTIPTGSTLYIQNKGSAGAEISNWMGPDHSTQSGSASVSFTVKRTSGSMPDPLAIYVVNVNEQDKNNCYKEFTLQVSYSSTPA